jgi:hypothetical protein
MVIIGNSERVDFVNKVPLRIRVFIAPTCFPAKDRLVLHAGIDFMLSVALAVRKLSGKRSHKYNLQLLEFFFISDIELTSKDKLSALDALITHKLLKGVDIAEYILDAVFITLA